MPKRKAMSSVQRTLRALRDQGRVCAIVERYNQYAGPFGRREDLFGIIDIIALDPKHGVVGIQACGADFAAHVRKIIEEKHQETYDWLSTPGTSLELWGWTKKKVRLQDGKFGKAMRWTPRVRSITKEDLSNAL